MGNPMAGHLVKAGFDVTVYDINPEASEKFVAQHGGNAATSLAELGRNVEAVITMLPTDKIVREAMLGISAVDAPVMGGVVFAKDGTLDIMVAGDATAVERVTPLLKAMGRSII